MSNRDNQYTLELAEKNIFYFTLMNKWTRLLQDKKTLASYFEDRGLKKIAMYGFGIVGETFLRELKNSDIEIEYIVDQNAEYLYAPLRLLQPEDQLEDVDVLVITIFDKNGELLDSMRNKCGFRVVSIMDVVNEV